MNALSREGLLAALPTVLPEPVAVPALDLVVFVRPLSGIQRDALELNQHERRRKGLPPNFRGMIVALGACTESGVRVFTDEDAEALGAVRADVLEPIAEKIQQASGYSVADVKALGKDLA